MWFRVLHSMRCHIPGGQWGVFRGRLIDWEGGASRPPWWWLWATDGLTYMPAHVSSISTNAPCVPGIGKKGGGGGGAQPGQPRIDAASGVGQAPEKKGLMCRPPLQTGVDQPCGFVVHVFWGDPAKLLSNGSKRTPAPGAPPAASWCALEMSSSVEEYMSCHGLTHHIRDAAW